MKGRNSGYISLEGAILSFSSFSIYFVGAQWWSLACTQPWWRRDAAQGVPGALLLSMVVVLSAFAVFLA